MPDLTTESPFIRSRTVRTALEDGTSVVIRPLVPGDREQLAIGFSELSDRSRALRFFSVRDHLTEGELDYLTNLDYDDHFAWGAITADGEPHGLGVARYVRIIGEPTVAEAAVTVIDEYQGKGLGTILLDVLSESALVNGVTRFRGYVSRGNERVLAAAQESGATVTYRDDVVVEVELPAPIRLRDSTMYTLLRSAARGEIAFGR